MSKPIFSSAPEVSVERRGRVLSLMNDADHDESQIALLTLTEDAKEGQKAFQGKRKRNWVDH